MMYQERLKLYWISAVGVVAGECTTFQAYLESPDPFSAISDRIMEVALDFPHASCVAVDLVPLQSLSVCPPTCPSYGNADRKICSQGHAPELSVRMSDIVIVHKG